ncbi:MAG: TonB family protein [Gammaproteobacteria bacterium]|nr:TonB family protein [Gammaproteobacteria bacterium]
MPIVSVPSTILTEHFPANGAAEGRWTAVSAFWPRALTLAAAVILHAVALAALVIAVQTTPGSSGTVLEAIEVELVDGSVLASRELAPANIITGALADIARTDGAPAAAMDGSASSAATQEAEPLSTVKTPDAKVSTEPAPDEAAFLDDVRQEMAKVPQPRPVDTSPGTSPALSSDAGSGGSAARAQEASPATASAAQVRAAAGDVRAYAQSVSAALARSRPRGGMGNGVSRVVFTIDRDGSLADVTVSRSSGNVRLDTLAIEAVRRAKFVAPPPTFSVADRTFEVPYTFR